MSVCGREVYLCLYQRLKCCDDAATVYHQLSRQQWQWRLQRFRPCWIDSVLHRHPCWQDSRLLTTGSVWPTRSAPIGVAVAKRITIGRELKVRQPASDRSCRLIRMTSSCLVAQGQRQGRLRPALRSASAKVKTNIIELSYSVNTSVVICW